MKTSPNRSTAYFLPFTIVLFGALIAGCGELGGDKSTTHIVDVQISANGCPEMPESPQVYPGDNVRIQIDSSDADASSVKRWAIAFTEGGLSCGCEVNNPENAFVCQIPAEQEGPVRYCYSIYTKMSNTSYCELDPTIFVNRNLGGGVLQECDASEQMPSDLPPEMTCDAVDPLDPDTWL